MRLVPCKLEDLMASHERSYMSIYSILTDFLNGNDDCVRVEDDTHLNVDSCVRSLRNSIKRYYDGLIKVINRNGDVYLVKTTALK